MISRIIRAEAPGNGRRPVLHRDALPPTTGGGSWDDLRERVEHYVGDHPVLSLAAGFTIGIVVGCVIKRR